MIEESEARQRILAAIDLARPESGESVSLFDALDRISARDVFGRVDLPGFDNSSMDGYAVRAAEARTGDRLHLSDQEQPAGEDRRLELEPGYAIRIFTGAPIPSGADAVIMQEDVRRFPDTGEIEITDGVEKGENIRPRGGDICAGQKILEAGSEISPAVVGLLASQGFSEVEVRKQPSVGIVSTGDEVVEVGTVAPADLPDGCLYNSNGPMLESLARKLNAVTRRWHAPDEPVALREILAEALEQSDFLLIAGGVSVGDRDFVKQTLADLGVESDFWRVRVKPGKPFLFGKKEAATGSQSFVFGLPGNPVSAFVTFQIFAAPAIQRWFGTRSADDELPLRRWKAPLAEPLKNPGDRPHYLRLRIDPETGALRPTGLQQSHALFGLSRADALFRMEPGEFLEAGAEVTVWLL